jgi:hypothetical protein
MTGDISLNDFKIAEQFLPIGGGVAGQTVLKIPAAGYTQAGVEFISGESRE